MTAKNGVLITFLSHFLWEKGMIFFNKATKKWVFQNIVLENHFYNNYSERECSLSKYYTVVAVVIMNKQDESIILYSKSSISSS